MTPQWKPYRESLRATALRTGIIAMAVGAVLAAMWGGIARWPFATLLALWPSFGGHWVEIWFLNWLRPRLPDARVLQVAGRLIVWFAGGTVLAAGMALTAIAFGRFQPGHLPRWWLAGVVFIGIELVAHIALVLQGKPSFYDGRG